jgi:hypothetical protein
VYFLKKKKKSIVLSILLSPNHLGFCIPKYHLCHPSLNDDSEELSQQTINSSRQMYNKKADTKLNKNSSPRVPITNFVANPSDSDEDLPKQGSIGNARPITGLSRWTKASSPNASRSSYLKAKGTFEASSTLNYGVERKSSSTKALRKPSSQTQIIRHPSSEKIFFPITFHLR